MFDALSTTPDNAETLAILRHTLELAQGFTLLFARANLPTLRDDLIARLALNLGQERAVHRLDLRPSDSVLRLLMETCQTVPQGGSLHVCGLEHQMPYGDPHPPVLNHLNLARDRFRALDCPAVFWLRDDALTRVARGAPDFWAWRSGVFEFEPDPNLAQVAHDRQPRDSGTTAWWNLSAEEKATRLVTLEGLLEDYHVLEQREFTPQVRQAQADLYLELGKFYYNTDKTDNADRSLNKAIQIYQAVGDRLGEANTLQAIGDVHRFRDDNDAALETYQQALSLFRAVGSRLGEANVYRSLALIEHQRERFEQALALFDQALVLYRAIGDTYSQAVDRGQRADSLIALDRRDEARADLEFALQVYTALDLPYADWARARLAELS